MNISILLLRPSNPECGTVASFHFDGAKRRKGLGVTVPTERWDRKRQRLKVSATLHRDERTRLMALNQRIDHQLKAIQDTFHSLSYGLEREPTWEEFIRALDRLQASEEKVVEATLTFYEWVESFIVESETHRTNAKGQKLNPRTIAKYRTVLLQLNRFATTQLGRAMRFEDWDETLVNRYKTFRANQGCKVSTIGKDLAVIKVWLKKAHQNRPPLFSHRKGATRHHRNDPTLAYITATELVGHRVSFRHPQRWSWNRRTWTSRLEERGAHIRTQRFHRGRVCRRPRKRGTV